MFDTAEEYHECNAGNTMINAGKILCVSNNTGGGALSYKHIWDVQYLFKNKRLLFSLLFSGNYCNL